MTSEYVAFKIGIKKVEDAEIVKNRLEQFAQDLRIYYRKTVKSNSILYGTTSRETYEKTFGAELEEKTETDADFILGKLERKYWAEKTPAKIPEKLQDKIEYVKLDRPIYSPEIKKE